MNADSTFQIGHDHVICEDYALAGTTEYMAYGVVCDGCSASPDVDFGARCLAFAAKESLGNGSIFEAEEEFICGPLGQGIVRNASAVLKLLRGVDPQALDATLLMAAVLDDNGDKLSTAMIHGDGVIVRKRKDGYMFAVRVELESGAPDYLSYSLNYFRQVAYNRSSVGKRKVITLINREPDGKINEKEATLPNFYPYKTDSVLEEGDILAVMSDGVGSFRRADNEPIPWFEVAMELVNYKSTAGQFVLRRMNAFKRKCAKEGWTHSDDVSVAAIVV